VRRIIIHPKMQDIIIHPFAFAVFPILSLYVKNIEKGHTQVAIITTIEILALAALCWLLVTLFVQDKRKSSLIVSVFLILFFSYGHAISAFSAALERMQLLDQVTFLVQGTPALIFWLVIGGVLFVALAYFIKSASDAYLATEFSNIVGLALVMMVGVNFFARGGFRTVLNKNLYPDKFKIFFPVVARQMNDQTALNEFKNFWQETMSPENTHAASGSSPDIYYIILDMYARADYLEKIYHYDNSEFLSFLTGKGFYVAGKSTSNYPYTAHSLASSLNSVYLDEIGNQANEQFHTFGPSIVMLKTNRLFQFLRNHDYTIVAFSTGFEFTEIKDADVYMSPALPWWQPDEFQNALINITPLSILPIHQQTQDNIHRTRVLYTLDHIADGTKIDSPTFVFAHVVAPHPPYAFGANGEPVQSKLHQEYTYEEFIETYRNQVSHINKKIQTVIEEILSQSPEPPIIIVQSDHGSCFGTYHLNLPERMSILNTYYFPDQNYQALYESITPVNTFRIILNDYFGTNYKLLEDKNYYSSRQSPYSFTDVTDQVLSGN